MLFFQESRFFKLEKENPQTKYTYLFNKEGETETDRHIHTHTHTHTETKKQTDRTNNQIKTSQISFVLHFQASSYVHTEKRVHLHDEPGKYFLFNFKLVIRSVEI